MRQVHSSWMSRGKQATLSYALESVNRKFFHNRAEWQLLEDALLDYDGRRLSGVDRERLITELVEKLKGISAEEFKEGKEVLLDHAEWTSSTNSIAPSWSLDKGKNCEGIITAIQSRLEHQEQKTNGTVLVQGGQITYQDGIVSGDAVFYANGGVMRGNLQNGKQTGHWSSCDKDGNLLSEGNFEDGVKQGKHIEYKIRNGNRIKIEKNYQDGQLEGEYKEFYPNGKLATVANFKNGQLDGYVDTYYENGNLRSHGEFENGEKRGTHSWFLENGQLEREEEYAFGMGYFWDGDKLLQDALKRQVQEDVKSEAGYSAEELANAAKEALKINDGIEGHDIRKTQEGLTGSKHSVMHDMLEKATNGNVAENIVRAGLDSEHLSTSASGLEEGAKTAQKVLDASEKSSTSEKDDLMGLIKTGKVIPGGR